MAYQFWISPNTGYRRKGTAFAEIKNLFVDHITAKTVYEPLQCVTTDMPIQTAKAELQSKEFDVAGIKHKNTAEIIGYIFTKDLTDGHLKQYIRNFETSDLISDSTPLSSIFQILSKKEYIFILYEQSVVGILTKADINKPSFRIYLFGMISLIEMHFNYWIHKYFTTEKWKELLSESRLKKALHIYNSKKDDNQELSLIECLQICDKRDILNKVDKFLHDFNFDTKSFKPIFYSLA